MSTNNDKDYEDYQDQDHHKVKPRMTEATGQVIVKLLLKLSTNQARLIAKVDECVDEIETVACHVSCLADEIARYTPDD